LASFLSDNNDSEYEILKNILDFLENKEVYIEDEKANISVKRDLKRALMYLTVQHGTEDGFEGLQSMGSIEMGKTLSKIYFQSCIKFSNIPLLKIGDDTFAKTTYNDDYKLSNDTVLKILHYKKWNEYIDIIEKNIVLHKKHMILSKEPNTVFKSKFKKEKMMSELENMFSLDLILKEEIISFKDTFTTTDDNKKVDTFYTLLFNTFFTKAAIDIQITFSGTRIRFYKDVQRKNIESLKVNLLYNRIPDAIL
jgi:hypothetical protein